MTRREIIGFITFLEVGCGSILLACLWVIVGIIQAPWSRAVWCVSPVWLAMLCLLGVLLRSGHDR